MPIYFSGFAAMKSVPNINFALNVVWFAALIAPLQGISRFIYADNVRKRKLAKALEKVDNFENRLSQLFTKNGPTSFFDSVSLLETSKLHPLWSSETKTRSLEKLAQDYSQNVEVLVATIASKIYFGEIPMDTLDRLQACMFAVDRRCQELDIDLEDTPFKVKDNLDKMRTDQTGEQPDIIDVEGVEAVRRPRLHPNRPNDKPIDVRVILESSVEPPIGSPFSIRDR